MSEASSDGEWRSDREIVGTIGESRFNQRLFTMDGISKKGELGSLSAFTSDSASCLLSQVQLVATGILSYMRP